MARDPTNTGGIRRSFRTALGERVQRLGAITRAMIVSNDTLGLAPDYSGVDPNALANSVAYQMVGTSQEDKLALFSDWFNDVSYNVLVGRDGSWTRDYIERAHLAGINDAARETNKPMFIVRGATRNGAILMRQTQHELQGIADVTVQQASRAVADGMLQGSRPNTAYRSVHDVLQTIAKTRGHAMANNMVVRAYNNAKLDVYKQVGVRKVGVNAESEPARHRRIHDARASSDNADMVEVLTAGDDLVCQTCEDISNDGPYTLDEAQGLIPAHPNCRCAFVPFWDERFAELERE